MTLAVCTHLQNNDRSWASPPPKTCSPRKRSCAQEYQAVPENQKVKFAMIFKFEGLDDAASPT